MARRSRPGPGPGRPHDPVAGAPPPVRCPGRRDRRGPMTTAIHPDLKGASVMITGGGSGIGAALTEGFLRQGARVAFVGRSDYSAFADEMARATGTRPLALRADISDTTALKAAFAQAAEAHGPIAVLVNNAANDRRHTADEVDDAFWDSMMAINLKAYFFAIQAVVPGMRAQGGGAIVNFSSISY